MAKKPIFDDDYVGPCWTYGLTYRPHTWDGVPKGWIVFSDRKHPEYPFGTIDYPFALTDEQIARADITLVDWSDNDNGERQYMIEAAKAEYDIRD